ncbi:MAG: hypothetical protein KIT27_11265 [Legionellales bacterium]|nr:hypothetical protein [Legionellales bacterium]
MDILIEKMMESLALLQYGLGYKGCVTLLGLKMFMMILEAKNLWAMMCMISMHPATKVGCKNKEEFYYSYVNSSYPYDFEE